MAVPKVNEEECTACGACADACPAGVIEVGDVATIANPDDCAECGSCVDECPVGAITM